MVFVILSFIFILGLCIGSFLNVISDRLPENKSFIKGRSHCDACRHTLQGIDLIPVVSYISLHGKCRYCKAKFSPLYPISELLTGIAFILIFLHVFGLGPILSTNNFLITSLLYYLSITSLLIIVFLTDSKYGIIPNKIVLIGTILSCIFLIIFSPPSLLSHLLSAIGASLLFLMLTLITRGKGMGLGDVKFTFFMGLFLGFPGIVIALYIAFLTGALVAGILILCHKKKLHGSTIPFGPFLVFGTCITFLYQPWILNQIMHILFNL